MNNKPNNGQKMTQDEFLKVLEEEYQGKITCEDVYVNARTPIKFYCHEKFENGTEHGEFMKTPYEVLRMHRYCPHCMGTENRKPQKYWHIKEHCEEAAKKCKNKWEFHRKYTSASHQSRINGWLEEFNEKYFTKEIQYRNLNEKIHCVYAYLFNDDKTCYIGRTSNIKRRHRQHKNGYNHSEGNKTYDNLWKYCEKHRIEMPNPYILAESLTAIESQQQEEEWLNKYIADGWKAINKASVGVNKSSLGAVIKWTYEACKAEAAKYRTKEEFKKNSVGAHNASRREGWIKDFLFDEVKLPNGYWDILENCQKEALKYKNFKDMTLNGAASCYNSIRKHKWQEYITFKP